MNAETFCANGRWKSLYFNFLADCMLLCYDLRESHPEVLPSTSEEQRLQLQVRYRTLNQQASSFMIMASLGNYHGFSLPDCCAMDRTIVIDPCTFLEESIHHYGHW